MVTLRIHAAFHEFTLFDKTPLLHLFARGLGRLLPGITVKTVYLPGGNKAPFEERRNNIKLA